jgi:hypothetical protein
MSGRSNGRAGTLTGTADQITSAERIRPLVDAEFERIERVLEASAAKRVSKDRLETMEVIEILRGKRAEVMANQDAAYFVREWRELKDQVRQLMAQDPRYQAIKAGREAHRS